MTCRRCGHAREDHTFDRGCTEWVRIVAGLPDTAPCTCTGWVP